MSILLIFPVKKEIISLILDQKYSTMREKCCAFTTTIISAFEKTKGGKMRENSEKSRVLQQGHPFSPLVLLTMAILQKSFVIVGADTADKFWPCPG